jgi:hypothetical protein
MRDPENDTTPIRLQSGLVVAGNDIAHDDGGWPIAERRARIDAGTAVAAGVVGSLAIDDCDIERSPERRHANSDITVIIRRDSAEHAGDWRSVAGNRDPVKAVMEAIVFDTEKLIGALVVAIGPSRHWPNKNAPKREIPDDAVFDGEVSARVEPDAIRCPAAESSLDRPRR